MQRTRTISILIVSSLILTSSLAAQRIHVGAAAAYMAHGTYFDGPGGARFTNRDGLAAVIFGDWALLPALSAVLQGSVARSDWAFRQVPIVGDLDVGGARLWFADAGVRFFPLELQRRTGSATGSLPRRGIRPFVQAGMGVVRYSISNAILDEAATNVAVTIGAGIAVPIGPLRAELSVKDWIVSFESVDEAGLIGAAGRRAHTLAVAAGLGIGL
jgi:hypothetical protein